MNFQFKTFRGGKGEPLRPYTAGSDLLFTQVLDRTDTAVSSILSLIFVDREEIDRAQPLELCENAAVLRRHDPSRTCYQTPGWNKLKFRAGLLEWIDSLGAPVLGGVG